MGVSNFSANGVALKPRDVRHARAEGKATVCLPVCLKIIDIVCILAQKIINLQYIQNPNIKISCCDFVEKRCFQVLCFYQLSISEQQSKKLKKIEKLMQEIIIFSKVFHGFLF
jgi:hypothetical protein